MNPSAMSWRTRDTIGLPVEKLVKEELLTSKGTSRFQDALLCSLFALSSATGAITKSLEVLHQKIERIARKMETLEKEVNRPRRSGRSELEMSLQENLPELSMEEIEAWLNSPMPTLAPGTSVDITCYETLQPSCDPLTGRPLM